MFRERKKCILKTSGQRNETHEQEDYFVGTKVTKQEDFEPKSRQL